MRGGLTGVLNLGPLWVPAILPVVVVLVGPRTARWAGSLVTIGKLLNIAVHYSPAIDSLSVLFATTTLAVVVVDLVLAAAAIVVAVSITLTLTITIAVTLAITVSVTVSFSVLIALSVPLAISVTVVAAIAIPVSWVVGGSNWPAVRQEAFRHARFAKVALTLGDGLAAVRLEDIAFRAAAPAATTMGSFISAAVLAAFTATLAVSLGVFVLLPQATDMLVKGTAASLFVRHCLKLCALGDAGFHLLVAVTEWDGRIQPFHIRA
jgi:hypothetical protein